MILRPLNFLIFATIIAGLAATLIPEKDSMAVATGRNFPIKIVATTGMVADAVRRVGGERVAVTGLMGEGVDPHLYKASPGDLRLLSDADAVFYSGLHLEGRMVDVLGKLGARKPTFAVTDTIDAALLRQPPEFAGHPDPHVWFDVGLWSKAVERVGTALAEIDPAGKSIYEQASKAYLAELAELDTWVHQQIESIPPESRLLVTAHDAFGYFGRAYGIEVKAIQGISTDSEASLKDMNALVDLLVEHRVRAVFVESSVPRKTVEALVEGCRDRGHTVAVGGQLFSDAMGAAGTDEGTYPGMIRHNVRTIVAALRGDRPAKGNNP